MRMALPIVRREAPHLYLSVDTFRAHVARVAVEELGADIVNDISAGDLDPEMVIRRTIEFGMEHYPEKTKEEHWQRFMEHMHNKYSSHGYIKMWLPGSDNENKLKQLRELINAPQRMRLVFDRIFDEEKKQ